MSSILRPNERLLARFEQFLVSPNGQIELKMQSDGNLVLRNKVNGDVLFQTGTHGNNLRAIMETTGNLEVQDQVGTVLFTSGTRILLSFLQVQDDRNVVICKHNGSIIWANGIAVSPMAASLQSATP